MIQVNWFLDLVVGFALSGDDTLFRMKFVQEVQAGRVHGHVRVRGLVDDRDVVHAVGGCFSLFIWGARAIVVGDVVFV